MRKTITIQIAILIVTLIVSGIIISKSYHCDKDNGDLKTNKFIAKKDRVEMGKLALADTSVSHETKKLKDSIKYHLKRGDYWKAKYMGVLNITKQDVKDIFKEDSTTIAIRVKKGIECDSLQKEQGITIGFFVKENNKMDSLIKIKNKSICYGLKLDSLNGNIQKSLEKKLKNRTLGEVALGVILLLAIIFH